jgi:hypothetical protein
MTSLSNELWQIGLASMGRGAVLAPDALKMPVLGNSEAITLPKRSRFGIRHQPNGGVCIVNPLDIEDDRREARR